MSGNGVLEKKAEEEVLVLSAGELGSQTFISAYRIKDMETSRSVANESLTFSDLFLCSRYKHKFKETNIH